MTERIDLDDIDAGDSERDDQPNRGDWFWRGEGDPDDPEAATEVTTDADSTESASSTAESTDSESSDADPDDSDPIPRVPRENEGKPAGIPMESGGSGAGAGAGADAGADASTGVDAPTGAGADASADEENTTTAEPATSDEPASGPAAESASGPHGGGADDMTLAFTYGAATRLSNFGAAALDADRWADWVGLVGDVPAHVINKFQRDRNVDLDFFNGSARGPGERLAAIDRHSMFYAERTVVVGLAGEDEAIAERADWEFVPLAEAAEKAGWEVEGDESDAESEDDPDDARDETDAEPVGETDAEIADERDAGTDADRGRSPE